MASRASAASMRPSWFTQVSEYWPFFQLFLANQARHKPFGGSSDAFRILNEKIPSALNFFFFSLLLFFFLSNLLFFLFSRRRPRIFVSSENDGPSLVKVIGENECTEYTEITYFQPSLRCFQGTRETMASHFLSIPEQQREVSLRMYLFQIQGVPLLLGHLLDFDRSIFGLSRICFSVKKRQSGKKVYISI